MHTSTLHFWIFALRLRSVQVLTIHRVLHVDGICCIFNPDLFIMKMQGDSAIRAGLFLTGVDHDILLV